MEVHHHSHTESPPVGRPGKKLTHYFWEFFMLFLAVTLGFFVENQREHYIEHQRELQYIHSFIEDLKKDTVHANRVLEFNLKNHKGLDSLLAAVKDPSTPKHPENIYKYASYLGGYSALVPNKRTIQQLKNSGGLRLIRKQFASDAIMEYDIFMESVIFQGNEVLSQINRLDETESMIIDRSLVYSSDINTNVVPLPVSKQLFTNDKQLLNKYFNQILMRKSLEVTYDYLLLELKKLAKNVIEALKKEYHLK